MGGHRDPPVLSSGGVLERSLLVPSHSLIKGPGSCVAGDDCEPGLAVSVRSDLPLGLTHQNSSDASPSMESRDVHLLDLIVDDHNEASDDSGDGGHCSVPDAFRCPRPERILSPGLDQLVWNKSEVAILPTEMPDLSNVIRILCTGFTKHHSWSIRDHRSIIPGVDDSHSVSAEQGVVMRCPWDSLAMRILDLERSARPREVIKDGTWGLPTLPPFETAECFAGVEACR